LMMTNSRNTKPLDNDPLVANAFFLSLLGSLVTTGAAP
jgi:hypothetical protein